MNPIDAFAERCAKVCDEEVAAETAGIMYRNGAAACSVAIRSLDRSAEVAQWEARQQVFDAANELVPFLREGWDEQDEPDDQALANAACEKLIAAIDQASERKP